MSTFSKSHQEAVPTSSDSMSQTPDFIKDTKISINERFELEHNALDSAEAGSTTKENDSAQGRHIPGKVSVLYSGNPTTLGTVNTGCIVFDTTVNILKRYLSGVGWQVIHKVPVFKCYLSSDQSSITSQNINSGTPVRVDFGGSGAVVFDNCSGFSSANDAYVIPLTGYYLVSAHIAWDTDSPTALQQYTRALHIFKNSSSVYLDRQVNSAAVTGTNSYPRNTQLLTSLMSCTLSDVIDIRVIQNSGRTLTLQGDSKETYLDIHYISG
jgi:hypothetical protein